MPSPAPAQRLRAELAVAQSKLEATRREVDRALAAGITHELLAGLQLHLSAVQASVWRLSRVLREMGA